MCLHPSLAARCASPPVCENDGFVTSSCVCQCPRGLTGERCHLVDTEQGKHLIVDALTILTNVYHILNDSAPKQKVLAYIGLMCLLQYMIVHKNDYNVYCHIGLFINTCVYAH